MKKITLTMELPSKEAQEALNHILMTYSKYKVIFKMEDLDG